MKRFFFNTLILSLLLLPSLAEALTPVNFKGVYICTFSGIPIGKMGLEIEETPEHYAIAADVTTAGLLKLFVKHQSHSTVEATGHDFTYETHYRTRDKKHYVRLVKKDGRIEETQVPPDNHASRPAVREAMLKTAIDPLSLMVVAREKLQKTLSLRERVAAKPPGEGGATGDALTPTPLPEGEGNSFSIDVYDGNRLTEADFTLAGGKAIYYGNRKVPVIRVIARRKPLAGFTQKELNEYHSGDPALNIYFSDDAELMPLELQMALPFGLITATLAKQCLGNESCLLGIR